MTNEADKNWKCAEISLPYFKQGDDLASYIEDCSSMPEAFEQHAMAMDAAAETLRGIKKSIGENEVFIDAMTHMISIEAEASVIDRLVSEKLAYECEDFNDEDELNPQEDRSDDDE